MRSWKTSATESIFSVSLPSRDSNSQQHPTTTVGSSKASTQRSSTPRNAMPCGRCSEKQKRCDISPPYSPTRCGACAKANISVCPPHKSRRLRKRARIRASSPVDAFQFVSTEPVTLQSNGTNSTKNSTEDSGPASYPEANGGPDQSSISTASSSQMFWPSNSGISHKSELTAMEGGLDFGYFMQPSERPALQAEESPYNSFYSFPSTFVPSFLSPL